MLIIFKPFVYVFLFLLVSNSYVRAGGQEDPDNDVKKSIAVTLHQTPHRDVTMDVRELKHTLDIPMALRLDEIDFTVPPAELFPSRIAFEARAAINAQQLSEYMFQSLSTVFMNNAVERDHPSQENLRQAGKLQLQLSINPSEPCPPLFLKKRPGLEHAQIFLPFTAVGHAAFSAPTVFHLTALDFLETLRPSLAAADPDLDDDEYDIRESLAWFLTLAEILEFDGFADEVLDRFGGWLPEYREVGSPDFPESPLYDLLVALKTKKGRLTFASRQKTLDQKNRDHFKKVLKDLRFSFLAAFVSLPNMNWSDFYYTLSSFDAFRTMMKSAQPIPFFDEKERLVAKTYGKAYKLLDRLRSEESQSSAKRAQIVGEMDELFKTRDSDGRTIMLGIRRRDILYDFIEKLQQFGNETDHKFFLKFTEMYCGLTDGMGFSLAVQDTVSALYRLRGFACYFLKQYQQAVEFFETALALKGQYGGDLITAYDRYKIYKQLGIAYFHLGEFEKSLENLKNSLNKNEDFKTVMYLFMSHTKLGNEEDAKKLERACRKIKSDDAPRYYRQLYLKIGKFIHEMGDFETAIIWYNKYKYDTDHFFDLLSQRELNDVECLLWRANKNLPLDEE